MPTYQNTTNRAVVLRGGTGNAKRMLLQANQSAACPFYVSSLPTGVTFVAHTPLLDTAILLLDATTFPSSDIDVYAYASLIISNITTSAVTLQINGDAVNTLSIPVNAYFTVAIDGKWGKIKATAGGTGHFKVWGI